MKPDKDPFSRRLGLPMAAAFALSTFGLVGVGLAHEADQTVVVTEPVGEDLYAVGQSVDVRADVDGDLVVAGQTVTLSGLVTQDVMAAGDSLTLAGEIRDDLRAAGRTITLAGRVGDHAIMAGGDVVLAASSRVAGFTWAVGEEVEVRGQVDGDLVTAGDDVTISGTIGGDVEIDAMDGVIAADAHIRGDLSWPRGQAPEIQPGARIDGKQIELAREGVASSRQETFVGIVAAIVLGTLSLLLLTWVLRAATPPLMLGAVARVREQPLRSFGIGLLALFGAPIVAVLALVTVIGAPLGLVLLLGYMAFLLVSAPVVLQAITDAILERRKRPPSTGARLGILLVAAAILVAVMQVPIVGWFVGLVVILLGLGALALRVFRRTGGSPEAAATTAPPSPAPPTVHVG